MRHYYTLEKATEKAYKEQKSFQRDNNMSFFRDTLNLIRMYFCLQPKFYYFDKKSAEKIKSPEPQSFHKNDDEYSEREKKYLQDLLEEDDFNYKW